ncbi:PREDICTED: leucine-rich repeat protein 1 [Dinoponera quadriceps]|uniref:Leucine-rich repeat protein 1 n=1 Tax=Dinoponera quadriceps TaxID=609295 RepID=A0A6P3WWM5_DINQU|nr:PREDICTED: leucine-rich repeat protein 1 [Dinoponera quadriceps]
MMRLKCTVRIYDRTLLSKQRTYRSVLTISKQSDKNEVYLLLQNLKNKEGIKYKIHNNVEKIFTKFIDDGKATISLKEPRHDLIIETFSINEVIQLKSFLHILKLRLRKIGESSFPIISNLKLKNMDLSRANKLVIQKKSEYPLLRGFPKIIEELSILGLGRRSFDRQILNLKYLKILNLSSNQIQHLPKEVGCLPHLQELIIPHNKLGKSTFEWKWISQVEIRRNLRLLDIRNNEISVLPVQVGILDVLVKLQVCQNLLTKLPQSIGRLRNLKYLEAARNNLSCLPGSMRHLRLDYLDISGNPFNFQNSHFVVYYHVNEVVTLVQYAAIALLKARITYDNSTMPPNLVQFLDNATFCCVCSQACFNRYVLDYKEMELRRVTCQVKRTANTTILYECYFCSKTCQRYF